MPTCTCGCNQHLTRRAIKKHLRGRAAPRLITAAVKACQTHGLAVSPPRLNPSKKLRSSRRYFPSSPSFTTVNEGLDVVMPEQNDDAGDRNESAEEDITIVEVGVEHAINTALEDVWSGLRHDGDNVDDGYDEDEDDRIEEEGYHPEGDSDDELYSDWDDCCDDKNGLSAFHTLGEEFERNAVANAGNLTARDMSILRAYTFKVDEHVTDKAFSKIPYAFPNEPVPTVKVCKARLQTLSGFKSIRYDCCINSCCCFAGEHKDRMKCPYCGEDRHIIDRRGNKKPRKVFNYLPFIPRLVAMQANASKAKEMQYRAFEHTHTADKISDVFDSHVYRRLLGKRVVTNGTTTLSHEYFSDPRDIALGLSTDGFCPFRRRKATSWPLVLFNYNLAPEIRFHGKNKIDLGAIPGPNKPKDFDSYMWPVFEEFMRMQHGVRTFDVLADEFFLLRAYLLLVFGDIPAISMVMRMTGHNGFSPCRMCKILGVRIPDTRGPYYIPLDRSLHPTVLQSESAIAKYDPAALPLRNEAEMLCQAREVQRASSKTQYNHLSKVYGIKGVSILFHLKSISFPLSFPYDFMHLIWENLIPNLVLLWTGGFKGLDEGTEEYQFGKNVWEAIGAASAAAGRTIPSVFGSRPPNIATNKAAMSAEAWSFWALYLGPVLLRRRFRKRRYYKHFIELVNLLQICLQFEITTEEVQTVRKGFIKWVEDYERMYYQHSPDRLSTCPVTIHALLHIADSIQASGPMWAYWAFPMERYCGSLVPAIKSRRFPFPSIDRYVTEVAQLTQIKIYHHLHEALSLRPPKLEVAGLFSDRAYPTCVLLPPCIQDRVPRPLMDKITMCLSTRFDLTMKEIRPHLQTASLKQYGKVRCLDGGDVMNASTLVAVGDDRRDATFVRYEMLVDKNARHANRPVLLEPCVFFGQLQNIFVIQLDASPALKLTKKTTLILAAIRACANPQMRNENGIYYYSRESHLEVVDIECVQCLVGRVKDGNEWAIVDRSDGCARPIFSVEED